jgi:hypothetical protein
MGVAVLMRTSGLERAGATRMAQVPVRPYVRMRVDVGAVAMRGDLGHPADLRQIRGLVSRRLPHRARRPL